MNRMTALSTCCVMLGLLQAASAAPPATQPAASQPSMEMPTGWFDSKQSENLKLVGEAIELEGKELARVGQPVAAAYYPEHKALVTVDVDCTTRLFIGGEGKWKQKAEDKFPRPARSPKVLFATVPGLVYVLAIDVGIEKELMQNIGAQIYPDVYRRVAIGEWAGDSQAIPSGMDPPPATPLAACYRPTATGIDLFSVYGRIIHMELPDPVAEPFCEGPGCPLARSVFNFPGILVTRTKKGWAVNQTTGKLAKWFSDGDIRVGWWEFPAMKDGQFQVTNRTGPGGDTYTLDMESGKLVKAK